MADADVIEFGAYNVNGTIRPLFAECKSYIGVDARPGPGVDAVGDARDYGVSGAYDIAVSCEMLEHCPEPWRFFRNAWRVLRPGGALVVTCASETRAPHTNDGARGDLGGEYYGGVTSDDVLAWTDGLFSGREIVIDTAVGDLYFFGRKA